MSTPGDGQAQNDFHFHSRECYGMGPGDTEVLICNQPVPNPIPDVAARLRREQAYCRERAQAARHANARGQWEAAAAGLEKALQYLNLAMAQPTPVSDPPPRAEEDACGEDHIIGSLPRQCFACLDDLCDALLEVAKIEQALQMRGYTQATARSLGSEAEDAYRSGGVPGLNDWRRRKREAVIARAEGR